MNGNMIVDNVLITNIMYDRYRINLPLHEQQPFNESIILGMTNALLRVNIHATHC